MTPDPLLQNLLMAAAGKGDTGGAVIRLVADGIVWQGRLCGPTSWAGAVAQTPAEDDVFRDSVTHGPEDTAKAASDYVHFITAAFLAGDGWHQAHGVRIAVASVSAWWLNRSDE